MPEKTGVDTSTRYFRFFIRTLNPLVPYVDMATFMERQTVQSVILRSVGYDESTKTMEIEFHSGLVYQYAGVPLKVYRDFMSSGAVGKYFSEKIRSRFRAKQITA